MKKQIKKSINDKRKQSFGYMVLFLGVIVTVVLFFGNKTLFFTKTVSINLYFGDHNSGYYLAPESRLVNFSGKNLEDQVKIIIKEVIKGPKGNLSKTIPEGVAVKEIKIKNNSTVIIDFSPELVSNHPGGSSAEIQTIYSIVNSILLNIPSLKEVQILVGGKTQETLKGHIDLRAPLRSNYSLVEMG